MVRFSSLWSLACLALAQPCTSWVVSPIHSHGLQRAPRSFASSAMQGTVSDKGLFAPLVRGAKQVMGEKELNELRGKVILEHSKVIGAFVDTSKSRFGQIALKALFEAADQDSSGDLDKSEVQEALRALGFSWIKEEQSGAIVSRADVNDDEVVDFEEFATAAPKTLRVNLIKLAKKNGADLGFLA